MFNKAMNYAYIRRLNREISNLLDNLQYVIDDKINNFSSISPKSCLLGQKYTGTWGVNTTIIKCYNKLGKRVDPKLPKHRN